MVFRKLFGQDDEEANGDPEGKVIIRIEVDGKTYVQRYADLEMAQIRFPQYLADLIAVHGKDK